jgi:hypothetical protein
MAKALLRLPWLPRLLSPTNPAIAGEGPLSPPTPQGAPSRSHHPCRRRAVPVQSCSSAAACRSRVFTELLVRSTSIMRCTTMVPPRKDYSMTSVLLPSATTPATTTKRHYCMADASSIYDGWKGETARASLSAASERALVAGRLRGEVNGRSSVLVCLSVWCLGESELHQGSECSSAHACRALRIRGVLITADCC